MVTNAILRNVVFVCKKNRWLRWSQIKLIEGVSTNRLLLWSKMHVPFIILL
jgi:hypothetical protein